MEGLQEPNKENMIRLTVQGGLFKDNEDSYLGGALALWLPLNASISGAVFEGNKVLYRGWFKFTILLDLRSALPCQPKGSTLHFQKLE